MEKMNLRQTQLATKDLLFHFDKLCSSLGIKYYLLFGTLLGAIRHGGFIPWDDDIDVGIMQDDYKLLEDYFNTTNDPIMEFHNPHTVKDCFFNISRVCDKKHYLVFQNRSYTSGLFIDVYLLEGMGNDEDSDYWRKQYKRIIRWRKGAL